MSLLYFAKIRKSVKKLNLDDLIRNLKNALSKAHKSADRDFLLKHLTFLQEKGLDNPATKKDLDFILKDIEKTLGQKLESLAEAPILQASMEAYTEGKKKVCKPFKIDYSLDDADLGALNTLDEFNGWYIRDKFSKDTSDIINRELGDLLERGGTKREFAQTLEIALEGHVEESKTYWELLADHTLTKIQNMGHVSGYETAGVQYVKIVAVIDSKTTPICRAMNNKVFKVADFRKQYDKIIRAAEKHDLKAYKAAQPMISGKDMSGEITDKEIEKLGIKLPPYHFRCRTTHVAYFEGERELKQPRKDKEKRKGGNASENKDSTPVKNLKLKNIDFLEVKNLKRVLSVPQIIEKVGGYDLTDGSCVSSALAYIGNKRGLDVLDFRGGESLEFFSDDDNLFDIAKMAKGYTIENKSEMKIAKKLLKHVKKGEEYFFAVAAHATIVKKDEYGLKYLELQNYKGEKNKFYPLTKEALATRFICEEIPGTGVLFNIKNLEIEELKKMLGYINTPEGKQKKE